jgi:TM2 domain-containing membrane protein YozV
MKPPVPSTSRWTALFLSGLILPGLGQIQLGEKKKGWLMILMVIGSVIITFAKFMMGVLQVAERHRFARPPSLQIWKTLGEAFQMEKEWVLGGLLITLLVWVLSILDLIPLRSGRPLHGHNRSSDCRR